MASRFLPLIFKFDEEFTEIFVVNKARLNFRKYVFSELGFGFWTD